MGNFTLFSAAFFPFFRHNYQKTLKLPLFEGNWGGGEPRGNPFLFVNFAGKQEAACLQFPAPADEEWFFHVYTGMWCRMISACGCMRKIAFSIAYIVESALFSTFGHCLQKWLIHFMSWFGLFQLKKEKKTFSRFPIFQEFWEKPAKKIIFPPSVTLIHVFFNGTFQKPVCRGTVYCFL